MLAKIKNMFLKKKENKFEKLMNCIDDIFINQNNIVIKLNKNLIVHSEGHQFFVSNGDVVIKSNYLHLNPTNEIVDDLKCGKGNKALKIIHSQNSKMGFVSNEALKYGQEILEEETSGGEEQCGNCK